MIVNIGTFHNVRALAMGEAGISILDTYGTENVIRFDSFEGPLFVDGEFGSLDQAQGMNVLEGVSPTKICAVTTTIRSVCEDFHTRVLKLTDTAGIHFCWELFCDGSPEAEPQAA